MKIAVIGYSGAGKSTLAKQLGEYYGLPVLFLDCVQFTAGWQLRDREEALSLVDAFMKQDGWVIDGNYRQFFQARRLEEADRILFLNFSRFIACSRPCGGIIIIRERSARTWQTVVLKKWMLNLSNGFCGMAVSEKEKSITAG